MLYTENFVVLAKNHAGGNGNLIINFAWPYIEHRYSTLSERRVSYLCIELELWQSSTIKKSMS